MRLFAVFIALASLLSGETAKPKIRAITAFVRLDGNSLPEQIRNGAEFLNSARDTYRKAGFDVETIRIATQPFPQYTSALTHDAALGLLRNIDALAKEWNFSPAIGPAMLRDDDNPAAVSLLADALSSPTHLNASLVIADDDGIHWNAVAQAARLIQQVAQHSPHGQGNLNFAAIAMLKPEGPFFPGAYHLGGGHSFAVGVEGANIVAEVFAHDHDLRIAGQHLAAALTDQLRDVEAIATHIAAATGWTYAGIDPTPAPLGEVSIGRAIESFTGSHFGAPGTMTAAALITRAVQSVPVKRVGYAGLMIPVLEDNLLAQRWAERAFTLDSLLAYSSVCAAGLDTVPLPGDISQDRIAKILGDVASLAYKWHKPLAARLLPIPGRKSGERTEFDDPRMMNTLIQ
jgi:uncharacterized protein (UPF0210 family)